ncbi:MAG: DPP IV N-terminal domain-containing protein, partial [Prolixibacteraceae bacterium]|nr:DPP IV N-terminal domain-containing protein [Prolixibacteraceae bacterium]
MKKIMRYSVLPFVLIFSFFFTPSISAGQGRIKDYPGYERFSEIAPKIRGSVKSGSLRVTWAEDAKSFEYNFDGKNYRFDVKKKKAEEIGESTREPNQYSRYMRIGRPARGRQYTEAESPDKKFKAVHRDRNLYLIDQETKNEITVTTEGNFHKRLKFGTASWVYGEELYQTTAMWWSPDSKRIAFYKFDESNVPDYYLQYKQTELYDSVEIEPYTKVGANNPVVDILIYDLESGKTITVDARDGKPFNNSVVGHYLYGVEWSPDGSELLFHRTNRKQDIMEWTAANPETGKCRVIVREERLTSFTENTPEVQFLSDNKRFIWNSERNGFKNYYLYDIKEGLISTMTNHQFEVSGIVKVDEKNNMFYYMARSGD